MSAVPLSQCFAEELQKRAHRGPQRLATRSLQSNQEPHIKHSSRAPEGLQRAIQKTSETRKQVPQIIKQARAAVMRELVKKATAAPIGQLPTGLSGLGTHIARTVRQRGGTYDMMMLGLQDPTTSRFAGELMGMIDSGRYSQARQTVITANFPADMRDRILGTLDHLRSQPGIPEGYRQMNLLSAFDPR